MYVTSFVRGSNKHIVFFLIWKSLGNHEDPLHCRLSLALLRHPAAPLFQTPLPIEIQKVQGESPMNQRCLSLRHRREWLSA